MSDFFEKYWQDKFNDFNSEPNANAWKNINHELFSKQVKSMFSHYFIKPSSNVWRKVLILLWWKKFTAFSPYTFNVYYISSAIIASLIIVSQLNSPSSSMQQVSSHSSPFKQNDINTQRSLSTILHQNQALPKSPSLPPVTQIAFSSNTTPTPVMNKKRIDNNIVTTHNDLAENIQPSPLTELSAKKCDSLERLIAGEQYPAFNAKELPMLLTHRSIGVYFAPVFTNAVFNVKSGSGDEFMKNYSPTNASTSLDYSASLFYEWQKYNYSVSVGFSLSKITKRYNYKQSQFTSDTLFSQQIIDNSHFQYSEVSVLNLDSLLLTGDTVWIHHVDSVFIHQIDTINSSQIVNKRKNTKQQNKFSFTTVEIPVLVGYSYSTGRLDFAVKGGVSLSYVALSVGAIASPYDDYGTIPVSRKTFSMFYMNAIGGVEATYHFSPKIALSIMPFYKQSITPVFSKLTPINISLHSFLLNVGLKYNIK